MPAGRETYSVGVDLGGTTLTVGVFDSAGALVGHGEHDTPVTDNPEVIADAIADAVRSHAGNGPSWHENIPGIAIGFPGPVDPASGIVKHAPNVQGLEGYPLADSLSERLDGLDVYLQNDAYCATLAELRWGAGRNVDNMVMLTLGTGVGGGVAMNNTVIRGPRQILGEVGHIIVDPNGRKCGCGNFGCLEAMAARDAIVEMAARAIQSRRETILIDLVNGDQTRLTPKIISTACQQGDQAAIEIYNQAGFYIGLAVCNCIVLADPDLVVIGGGIAAAGQFIIDPIKRTVAARSLISGFDAEDIVPAQYGNDAGVYGAGALVWEHH